MNSFMRTSAVGEEAFRPQMDDRGQMLCYDSLRRAPNGNVACSEKVTRQDPISEEGRKAETWAKAPWRRPYLLKKHTTGNTRKTSIVGVFALLSLGFAHDIGSSRANQLQAQASGTTQALSMLSPSDNLSPPREGLYAMVTQSSLSDTPPRPVGLSSANAGDRMVASAPLMTPSSHGALLLPGGAYNPPHNGQGNTSSPASQAHTLKAGVSVQPHRLLRSPTQTPSQERAAIAATLSVLTKATARTTWFGGPQAPAAGLATMVSLVHDRQARPSSLSLERLLDSQHLTSSAPPVSIRTASSVVGDSAITARRPPIAAGLKMVGVHPAATRYGSAPGPAGYAKASLIHSRPGSGADPHWTAATMPGGNAGWFRITGYLATGSRTRTGTIPHWGTVAVDPSVIPLGSTVYIQGLGVFKAEDTGGAIIGRSVDVFVATAAQAYQLTGYRLVSFVPPQ
jgi:3D (Asp-Asp-Asp) domain-containing protein